MESLSLTEEQKRQHEESMKQVQGSPKYLSHVNRGEIPLTWKQIPTIEDPYYNALLNFYEEQKELEEGEEEKKIEQDASTGHDGQSKHCSNSTIDPPKELNTLKVQDDDFYQPESCISSRGMVDVSLLKELLREGYNEFVPPPTPTTSSDNSNKTPVLKFPTNVKSVTNLWDIANARKSNVHIIRPSHDAWGIKKVALMFCDDFLQRVYDLPWWHGMKYNNDDKEEHGVHKETSKKLNQAMTPIFDVLGIQSTQVVRLLFAALPPGVTIPVHHDTGEWVKQTHRVHVPIFVPDNNDASCILFQCGPLTNLMNRVECSEGHVFEMNNQAKHMVSNCHSTEYRVHCILDYVSKDHPVVTSQERIQLNPGERIYQTRRSIDRECDQGKRSTPSFFILGAQKCGTTSLYNYITQHPLCVPTKKRETHGLDWRWPHHLVQTSASKKKGEKQNGTTNDETQQQQQEERLTKDQISKIRTYLNEQSYYCKELERYPSCLTGDSTPSYLVHPDLVIPRLKQIYPHLNKFLMIVRHPTKRCYSHYQMVTDPNGTETQKRTRGSEWQHKTFEQVVMEDFQRMSDVGLIPYWNISTQTFDQDVFDQFVGSKQEQEAYQLYQRLYIPQHTGSHTPVLRGMYHLQLRTWLSEFSSIDKFHIIALEQMTQDVYKTMKGVYEFLDLPLLSSIEDTSPKNTRTYRDPIPSSMETMLNQFYRPQNEYFIRFVTSFNNSNNEDDSVGSSNANNSSTKEWMTEEYWKDLWK